MEKKPSLAGRLVSTTSKETRIANLSRYFIFENLINTQVNFLLLRQSQLI